MADDVETLGRDDIARLISDQSMKIAKLTELLVELRVGGTFKGASHETKKALREVDELLSGEIGESILKTLQQPN